MLADILINPEENIKSGSGMSEGDCAAVERNKSVAEDHRRCQIYRRHRGHPSAGKPRRLIASSPKIPHSSLPNTHDIPSQINGRA